MGTLQEIGINQRISGIEVYVTGTPNPEIVYSNPYCIKSGILRRETEDVLSTGKVYGLYEEGRVVGTLRIG